MSSASATWDEIRGLAADLQRVQLASAKQRLTERNCIEIVQRLTQMGLIKLVYTCDGKCFLTEAELAKEIAEELELRQNRVNVVTLQEALNVDLATVEQRVRDLVKSDPQLHLVNGELMHDAYFRRVAHEVNETLYERGHVTLGELTIAHNLPAPTVLTIVRQYLGTVIQGSLDSEDALCTDRYLRRHRARVRGYFKAAVKPLTVQQASGQLRMPEKLLRNLLEELHSVGQLQGTFQGGKSTFVPASFSAAHDEWARGFYAQNQYIELEAIKRCGLVSDSKSYLRRLLADRGEPLLLKTCAVSPDVAAALEAALDGARWLDVEQAISVPLTDSDVEALLGPMLSSRPDLVQIASHYVISRKWLAELRQSFDQFLNERAEALVKADPSLLSGAMDPRHSQRRQQLDDQDDEAGGGGTGGPVGKIKSGGGVQGREIKLKSTKNKYAPSRSGKSAAAAASAKESNKDREADRESATSVALADVSDRLRSALESQEEASGGESSVSDEFVEAVFDLLSPGLNSGLQSRLSSVLTADSANKRQASGACQARAAALVRQLWLFERGAAALGDAELQATLNRHLAKSIGASLMCTLLEYVAMGAGLDDCAKQAAAAAVSSGGGVGGPTSEQRQKLVEQLPPGEDRDWLTLINLALGGDSMDKIHSHVDGLCGRLGLLLKPLDKKAEKALCAETAARLAESLDAAEPELALLVTVSLLVQACTGMPVHAPGRAVPQLIAYLRNRLRDTAAWELLQAAQELIVRRAKRDEAATAEIEAAFPRVVQLGKSWKTAAAKK